MSEHHPSRNTFSPLSPIWLMTFTAVRLSRACRTGGPCCYGALQAPALIPALNTTEQSLKVTGNRAGYNETMNALVSPDGISRICAFLASDDAEYVTGTIFTR